MVIELNVDGELVRADIDRVVNAGYSGRDQESVQEHIDELAEEGLEPPEQVPISFELAPYATLVDPGGVTVIGGDTSGEAEYGLLVAGGETFVVAASDQTDRALESEGIQLSKQIAPNVLSKCAWRLADLRERWDDIELRAWNTRNGKRVLYQDATLDEILPPAEILDLVRERYGGPLNGTLVLSGTVPTVSGELTPGERFEVELQDPVDARSIGVTYDVRAIEE